MPFILIFVLVLGWTSLTKSCSSEKEEPKPVSQYYSERIEPYSSAPTLSYEEKIEENKRRGALALQETDAAIRQVVDDERAALLKRAKSHRTEVDGNGRLDIYTMKDGKQVVCSTHVASGVPYMNCGQPH